MYVHWRLFFQIHEFSCLFILLPLSCSVSAFRFWQSIELLSKETGKRFFIDKSQAFPNFRVDKSASKWFRLAVLKVSVDVPVRCAHQMLVARLGHDVKLVDPCVGFGYVVTNAGQNLVVIDARTPWHSKWMEVILLPFTCWYVVPMTNCQLKICLQHPAISFFTKTLERTL